MIIHDYHLDLPEVFEEKLKLTSSTLKYSSIRIFWQRSDQFFRISKQEVTEDFCLM